MIQLRYFENREQMHNALRKEPYEWEMCLRNSSYGKCFGFYDNGELVCAGAFSIFDGDMHIYTFEVKDSLKGCGYGSQCFNILLDRYKDSISFVTLNYLDDDAESFWKRMGFVKDDSDDAEEDSMILFID